MGYNGCRAGCDISVVIPCYNGERYLAEAIDSVLRQTRPALEIMVVDDGSTDRSRQIVEGYGEKVHLVAQENRGLPAARNAGIRASRGQFIAFLDADDWWREDFLEQMSSALERSEAGIAYCGWQNVGLPGGRGRPFVPPDYEEVPDKIECLFRSPCWPVHAALVRCEVVESVGGFDPKWRSCEDFAFWLRTATRNRLVRVPEVLAFYRFHGNQMVAKRDVIAISHWMVQKEFLAGHAEVAERLGKKRIRELTLGELLRKGYECYWERDLKAARAIFRAVMRTGYGRVKDWKYMLPALLPLSWHRAAISRLGKGSNSLAHGQSMGAGNGTN